MRSTTEAELIADSSAGTELLWWRRLFKDVDPAPTAYRFKTHFSHSRLILELLYLILEKL